MHGVQGCIYDVYTIDSLQLNGAASAQKAHTSVCPPTCSGTTRAVFASLCLEIMFAQSLQGHLYVCVWLAQPSARRTGDSSFVTQWPSLSFPYFLSALCVNMGVKHQDKFSFCMSCFSTLSALIKISLIHFRT